MCVNPLSYWFPINAFVVRIEVHEGSVHSLLLVLDPILSENSQVGLTLEHLP